MIKSNRHSGIADRRGPESLRDRESDSGLSLRSPRNDSAGNPGRSSLQVFKIVLTILTAFCFLPPAAAQNADEPAGYRMEDYDAPVPDALEGADVVEDDAAYALWRSGRVAIIDVMPNLRRPEKLPKSVKWQGRPRRSIPGAIWLPDAGFGTLDTAAELQFRRGLFKATGGDTDAPIMFLCRSECWMSWNAGKRAVSWGYTRVFWYREGSTGWSLWDWPTERLTPPIEVE